MAGRKVQSTISLTERQDTAIRKEASRNDISYGDQIRRIFDDWLNRQTPAPSLAARGMYGSQKP